MSPNQPNGEDNKPLRIRRGRVESVDLFEIKETELELFRKGSPADLQLNFAIFLFSTAFSAIAALATATFPNNYIHTTFIVISVVGLLMGSYLLIAWVKNRSSLSEVCDQIRQRIKEPDIIVSGNAISRTEITATTPADPSEPADPAKEKED